VSQVPPGVFVGLFDDVAMFPPGSASADAAVARHREHSSAWYAPLIGPLVCAAARLDEVRAEIGSGDPIDVSVVAPCDWALLESLFQQMAAAVAGQPAQARVVAVEVSLGTEPGAIERAALACKLLDGAAIVPSGPQIPSLFVETPPGPERLGVLDVLAEAAAQSFMTAGVAAKLRTGGLSPEAFPADLDVADFLVACAARALTFKCTAGLHSAVRYLEAATGFEHQGFGNLLLAAGASIEGVPAADMVGLIGERDEQAVVRKLTAVGENWLKAARARFLSFGTCSVSEPIEDLVRLGLLAAGG
jgi:hypothetical protein